MLFNVLGNLCCVCGLEMVLVHYFARLGVFGKDRGHLLDRQKSDIVRTFYSRCFLLVKSSQAGFLNPFLLFPFLFARLQRCKVVCRSVSV